MNNKQLHYTTYMSHNATACYVNKKLTEKYLKMTFH